MQELEYIPNKLYKPNNILNVTTAWKGLENIILDILERFNVNRSIALEFGAYLGYSAVVLSNFFNKVITVDAYNPELDNKSGVTSDMYIIAKRNLSKYNNILLVKQTYEEFIKQNDNEQYDLIHIDLAHNYKDTYDLCLWGLQHSNIIIIHDTESYSIEKKAILDVSKIIDFNFYNYKKYYGLGILVKK